MFIPFNSLGLEMEYVIRPWSTVKKYAESMPFFVSAESGVDPISEPRQTEPAAIGFALDYIDRGFSALEISDARSSASLFEDFRLAYSAIPRAKK